MAVDPAHQKQGLGSTALRMVLADRPDINIVASTSRNPGVLHRMRKAGCTTVSPDLGNLDNPLHHYDADPLIQDATQVVAEAVGAKVDDLPFVRGKYGDELYGEGHDPGRSIPLPLLADHPGNAVIVIATDIQRSEP